MLLHSSAPIKINKGLTEVNGCCCAQAVQKAATDVGSAQKALQSGGASASPIPVATPSPPTININIPGLGGNGGTQGQPGISYSAPTTQAANQVLFQSSTLKESAVSPAGSLLLLSCNRTYLRLTGCLASHKPADWTSPEAMWLARRAEPMHILTLPCLARA
jgi:hypothetical protein